MIEKWLSCGIGMSKLTMLRQRLASRLFWRWNSELSRPPTQVATGARVAGGK